MSEHTKEVKKLVCALMKYLAIDRGILFSGHDMRKVEKAIQSIFRKYVPDPQQVRKLAARNNTLERIVIDYHWMARRYADGRQSYATSLFNEHVRTILGLGIKLNATADQTIWAGDAMGRNFANLTEAENTPGTPEALGEVVEPGGLWAPYTVEKTHADDIKEVEK